MHENNLERAEGGLRVAREVVDALSDCWSRHGVPDRDSALLRTALRRALLGAAYQHRACRHYRAAIRYYLSAIRSTLAVRDAGVGLLRHAEPIRFARPKLVVMSALRLLRLLPPKMQ